MNLSNFTHTIQSINDDFSVDVKFHCDDKVQNISGLDVTNADSLTKQLNDYCVAYVNGLASEQQDVPTEVHELVGKLQSAEE